MEKESFFPFEDDSYDAEFLGDEDGTKRRKPRPGRDELKEDFKKKSERERRRRKDRQKRRGEKDRTDWDAEE
jgi:hypothetical protein